LHHSKSSLRVKVWDKGKYNFFQKISEKTVTKQKPVLLIYLNKWVTDFDQRKNMEICKKCPIRKVRFKVFFSDFWIISISKRLDYIIIFKFQENRLYYTITHFAFSQSLTLKLINYYQVAVKHKSVVKHTTLGDIIFRFIFYILMMHLIFIAKDVFLFCCYQYQLHDNNKIN
jgi:hypothetical protein